ncbi:AAA family ATPase [Pseudomonas sp. SWRI22]|uniref:AAA family ATPase n=1 Tax=Pseudomonas sp. SWRI22 TaxID=2745513 RepID=UPI00164593DF|nr:AAA family ATPase [Pseudomonas sp. SWRI22]MBV4512809.1 AAA family ATPase [Pseudomonas sp. SWRI22]
MSLSGIRSNRGDSYQTLIAMWFAISMLSDADYEWLEVDSTRWLVDDVVVGKSDGSIICCQCKKNQPDFKPWTVADLSGEFEKASRLLVGDLNTVVRFYSRGTFGHIAKLREHCATQPDESSYRNSLTNEHATIDASLSATFNAAVSLRTYDFLRRTTFHNTNDFNDLEESLLERLRILATNAEAAYDALWYRLDQLGSRMPSRDSQAASVQHRLTKEDLLGLLQQSGSMLAPHMNVSEVRASLDEISAIGRNWRREMGGRRLPIRVVDDMLSAIDNGKRSILLTGLPGAGKTCALLAVQEALELLAEGDGSIVPLFIQSREFADLATAQDRHAQGLYEDWVEKVARLADNARVAIVIDSLDVLSISREHAALTYFLAQIDRLLLISNVTVLTACRDFDRRYDRRLASRVWECELACQPLDWNCDVSPLLQSLGIDIFGVDAPTRQLISNPRELAIFIELAQWGGGFSVVTSQALAQRYLDTLVHADANLGITALEAIESVADEMLRTRSLTIPAQRFSGSQGVLRVLLSHNVLHQAMDGRVGFGHQTLLDVLVISSAIRRGVTLNEFIQSLSPVPFVRPTIRSFVAQLAAGDRRLFRTQLRAVLMGQCPFHMRRLVAESFADRPPHSDDWPMLRDLRRDYKDVFQIIYLRGKAMEWGAFWFAHLVPLLRAERDQEGLMTHLHRSSLWVNHAPSLILPFWTELLEADWMDRGLVAGGLGFLLSDVASEHAALTGKLVEALLRMPIQEYSYLGRSIARCVGAGVLSDDVLWAFITGDVTEDDVRELHHFGTKLRWRDHEFGAECKNYIAERMKSSVDLLNIAIPSIEGWSQIRISEIGDWAAGSSGFLRSTSHRAIRSHSDFQHEDSMHLLLRAVEGAVLSHASIDSEWWRSNRERLCFNHEGALRYFGLMACIENPSTNSEIAARLFCIEPLVECEFLYELGCLAKVAFVHFDSSQQDSVVAALFAITEGIERDEREVLWANGVQARLIACIPCHLRPAGAQLLLDDAIEREGVLNEGPPIQAWSGMVTAPFPYSVFLEISDRGVLQLLMHYTGYQRAFEEHLVGGEGEVASMLREAASRDPDRFLGIMTDSWADLSSVFRDAIMSGAGNCLAHLHGNLQSGDSWTPFVTIDGASLAGKVIHELGLNSEYWQHNRAASNALNACANVVEDADQAQRMIKFATCFLTMREEASISGDGVDHLDVGINMARGHIAEALVILTINFLKSGNALPDSLLRLLFDFADEGDPAIAAVILRRLAYLQSLDSGIGWELFDRCMKGNTSGLWGGAEQCLYYSYRTDFERVSKWLARLRLEGVGKDFETWGRISALAALSDVGRTSELMLELSEIDDAAGWQGASAVWANAQNFARYRAQCIAGLDYGLSLNTHSDVIGQRVGQLFCSDVTGIPSDLVRRYFSVREMGSSGVGAYIHGLDEWLSVTAQRDAGEALVVFELYLAYVRGKGAHMYDRGGNLTQLLTQLFAEAEEWEEVDGGAMLQRVVSAQDELLSLGVSGIGDWLAAAERP